MNWWIFNWWNRWRGDNFECREQINTGNKRRNSFFLEPPASVFPVCGLSCTINCAKWPRIWKGQWLQWRWGQFLQWGSGWEGALFTDFYLVPQRLTLCFCDGCFKYSKWSQLYSLGINVFWEQSCTFSEWLIIKWHLGYCHH